MILELTNEEANELAALLDIATKAGGLQVAGGALTIFQKLKAAAENPDSVGVDSTAPDE